MASQFATASDRKTLADRVLPQMVLSEGTKDSMTPPPVPSTHSDPAIRAKDRFAISGNAIITGGAGHLALSAAKALLEHGCSGIALFDANPAQAETSIQELVTEFPQAKIIAKIVDVTSEEAVDVAVAEAWKDLGGISMLLCFAGVVGCVPAMDMTPSQFRRILDINTTGTFICAQSVARLLQLNKTPGSMIFIASLAAHQVLFPQPQVSYNASKAAVIQTAKSLAAEWARYGIRVNTISPGYMDTILNEGPGLEEARQAWKSRTPMGRMGSPWELTGPVVLLCSKAGSYITGADLCVDGGSSVF